MKEFLRFLKRWRKPRWGGIFRVVEERVPPLATKYYIQEKKIIDGVPRFWVSIQRPFDNQDAAEAMAESLYNDMQARTTKVVAE